MFNQTSRSVIAIILFITLLLSTAFVFAEENETQPECPYLRGQYAAKQDYKGLVSFKGLVTVASGFFSTYLAALTVYEVDEEYWYATGDESGSLTLGYSSGFVVWVGEYFLFNLLTASKDTDVPQRYISELDIAQKSKFEDGYKDYMNKKRKANFIITSVITAISVQIYVVFSRN
jgi:hypothetical protein